MKTFLFITCLVLLAWNVFLTRQLGRVAELAEHLKTESELSMVLARQAGDKASDLALMARRMTRNATIIVLRNGRAEE